MQTLTIGRHRRRKRKPNPVASFPNDPIDMEATTGRRELTVKTVDEHAGLRQLVGNQGSQRRAVVFVRARLSHVPGRRFAVHGFATSGNAGVNEDTADP